MRGLPAAFQPAKRGLEGGRRGWGEPAVPGDGGERGGGPGRAGMLRLGTTLWIGRAVP